MRIGSWRVVREGEEWFNPVNRMRIVVSENSVIGGSWSVFVFRKRRAAPGGFPVRSAPTSHTWFNSRQLAVDYAVELMNRDSLSFSDLNNIRSHNKSESIAYLKVFLRNWLLNTAHMKSLGPDTYEWSKVILKAYFHIENDVYFYFYLEPIGAYKKMIWKVPLGPWNNYGAKHYDDEKIWLSESIDKVAKDFVRTYMSIDLTREILSEKLTRGSPAPIVIPDDVNDATLLELLDKQIDFVKIRASVYKKIVDDQEESFRMLERGEPPKSVKKDFDEKWKQLSAAEKSNMIRNMIEQLDDDVSSNMKEDSNVLTNALEDLRSVAPRLRRAGYSNQVDKISHELSVNRALFELQIDRWKKVNDDLRRFLEFNRR